MQVVILCGGRGMRIAEVSENVIPKPMVTVGERPILWHIMKLYSASGHRRFILCLGYLGWKIKEYFLDYQYMNNDLTVSTGSDPGVEIHSRLAEDDWKITLADTGLNTLTAGRVRRIAPYLDGDHFMLTYGDGVSNVDLASLEQFHREHGKLLTVTGVLPPGRFGELDVDGSRVTRMREKPAGSDGRHINGGFMVMSREFIDRFAEHMGDDIMLENEPFAAAAEAGEMMMYPHHDFWQCMDTHRDWDMLNRMWEGPAPPWRVWS